MTATNLRKVTLALSVVTGLFLVFVLFQRAVTGLGRERALAANGVFLALSLGGLFTVVLVRHLAQRRRGTLSPAGAPTGADAATDRP